MLDMNDGRPSGEPGQEVQLLLPLGIIALQNNKNGLVLVIHIIIGSLICCTGQDLPHCNHANKRLLHKTSLICQRDQPVCQLDLKNLSCPTHVHLGRVLGTSDLHLLLLLLSFY